MAALVGEAGGLHVVAGSVCQAPSPREKGQALCFLQHNFQLLKVLQPSNVLVLDRKKTKQKESRCILNQLINCWVYQKVGCKEYTWCHRQEFKRCLNQSLFSISKIQDLLFFFS